jgi:hypothetical protein
MIAYEAGNCDKASDLLWPLRNELVSIGGSHAQRDLFLQILCDAAVRGDRPSVARSLLSERVLSRGTRKKNWQWYAHVLDVLGEADHANEARKQSETAPESGA